MATKKPAKFDFEASLHKLDSIVNVIERGGLSLEESLSSFAEGAELIKSCQQALKESEQKVKILTQENLSEFKLSSEGGGNDENKNW